MTDHTRLAALLRSALPPVDTRGPSRDLWPRVAGRERQRITRSWFDIALALAVTAAFFVWPDVLLLLAYHF
jgi:hypothetical protein